LIKSKRISHNWSQQHLADVCGISLRTVQRVERYGNASNETVMALASVLELERTEIVLPTVPVIEIETGESVENVPRMPRYQFILTLLFGMAIGAASMYFLR